MIYKILTAASTTDLSTAVNKHLLDGWELAGGLAIGIPSAMSEGLLVEVKKDILVTTAAYGNNLLFCQAVIK